MAEVLEVNSDLVCSTSMEENFENGMIRVAINDSEISSGGETTFLKGQNSSVSIWELSDGRLLGMVIPRWRA